MAVQETGRAWGRCVAQAHQRWARRASHALAPVGFSIGAWQAALAPARADVTEIGREIARGAESQNVVAFSVFIALGVFATVTAFLYVRERDRWFRRADQYADEINRLRAEADRADMLLAGDVQLLISWPGANEEPIIEGDVAAIAGLAAPRHALVFGTWLPPLEASRLEDAASRLRASGEPFLLQLRSRNGAEIEAMGRVIAGRAIMRIRDLGEERRLRNDAIAAREAAVRERDAMRELIDAIPHPAWMRDEHRRLTWVNRAYVRAVEASDASDAIGREAELLDHRHRAQAEARHAVGESYAQRVPAVMAGRRATIDVFETSSGGLCGGVAVDMSEIAALQDDLEKQAKAHSLTLDQLPTAVAIFDARQRLMFHNQAYRQLWNIDLAFLESQPTESELLDRLRAERMIPEHDDFRGWKTSWLQGYRTLEPRDQFWYLPDGRNIRVFANPNPQGGITYLFDDVSERHALELRYNSLTRVQRETLDMLKEGVAVFGPDGKLRLHNPSFGKIWDIPEAVLRLTPHVDDVARIAAIHAPDAPFWADMSSAVAGFVDHRLSTTARVHRQDGGVVDCAIAPLPDGGTLITFTDVTDSAKFERALTERNEALQRAHQLRSDFVQNMSYELRSPLNVVIGYTQMLGDGIGGPLNPKQREYASHIMRASNALLALIDNILDLQSIDSGVVALELGPVDLKANIDAVAEGVQDRLSDADVTFKVKIAPDIRTFIADGRRLRTVLFNLISNAIGFSPAGGAVEVAAERAGDELRISLSDQGPGIPEEARARIFERFEHHPQGSKHRGVGIGLSIVRSFIELHGGRVTVESAPGGGARFVCVLPYREGDSDTGAAARLLA
ncbi:PAS-domain containing protein [Terrarubrum flagellatum]|uniref:PAS-domain containing protein n=1 Tax=Terrirubrum flagellatum TaxID=2895980 RepID=UPI003144D885